jgi:hypothetical protein
VKYRDFAIGGASRSFGMYDESGQSTTGDAAAGSGESASWSANGTGVAEAPEAPKTDSAEFVDELLKAMKATAASQRARLNEDTDRRRAEHLATINARRDVEAARIRLLADDDRRSIESWAEEEHRRIREEQTRRIDSLHRNLEASLAEHSSRIDREIERLELAIGSYRTEVEAFFGSLENETDPVTIAQHASRRPTFPALDSLGSDSVQRATTADPEPAATLPPETTDVAPEATADATAASPSDVTDSPAPMDAVAAESVSDAPAAEAMSTDVVASDGASAPDAEVGEAVMAADAAPAASVEWDSPEPAAMTEPEPVAITQPVAEAEPPISADASPAVEAESPIAAEAAPSVEAESPIAAEAAAAIEATPEPFEPVVSESMAASPAVESTETVELIGSADDVSVPEPVETPEAVVAQATNGTYPIEIDTSPETTGIGVMEPLSQSKLAEAWAAWNRSTAAADAAAEAARAAEQAEGDAATEAQDEVEAAKPAGAYVEPVAAGATEQRSGPFSSGPGFARMSWLRRDKGENGN